MSSKNYNNQNSNAGIASLFLKIFSGLAVALLAAVILWGATSAQTAAVELAKINTKLDAQQALISKIEATYLAKGDGEKIEQNIANIRIDIEKIRVAEAAVEARLSVLESERKKQ